MESFLKNLDMLGPECKLKIDERSRYKSLTGGFLSLILMGLCTGLFVLFGTDMMKKNNPTLIYSKFFNDNPILIFNSSSIAFSIFNQADNSPISDIEKKFKFYFQVFNVLSPTNSTSTRFKVEVCDSSSLESFAGKLRLDSKYYYCIEKGANITLLGGYPNVPYKSLRLNQTENP